ncbi:GNAT family N-acetyltransferase [Paucibacter soli]|uniref:GNAT family N-acetyltransferase n=1 Tax=Paucibacter soli TaxID=3133433 RepID=UPI0030B2242D
MTRSKLSIAAPMSIRPLELADAEALLRLVARNEKRFAAGGLAMLPSSTESFKSWIQQTSGMRPQSLKVVYGLWVQSDAGFKLAGFVGIETLNSFSGSGVWYGIDIDHQGRGLAKTGALLAMVDFEARAAAAGFARIVRWVLHVHKSNERSARLGAQLGFQRDEILDYTRRLSLRGGQKFQGYLSTRTAKSMAEEAQARVLQMTMQATARTTLASNDDQVKPRRRLSA